MDELASSLHAPCAENPHLHTNKRLCLNNDSSADNENATSEAPTPSMQTLPGVALSDIGNFADNISFSEACRATLEATHEFHFKINLGKTYRKDWKNPAKPEVIRLRRVLDPQQCGRLASGRRVTRITITNCTRLGKECQHLLEAVRGIVRRSLPKLRSITIEKDGRKRRCGTISAILDGLVPRSAKHQRVAPNLTRVALHGEASTVTKAGKGIAAGLWPALEELDVSNCRANEGHFKNLARGLSTGQAPNLRVLNWGRQSCLRKKPLDDVLLLALSMGRCPRIEHLSFTGTTFCPEGEIHYHLKRALHACPNLRELRMDCSRFPANELLKLTAALEAEDAPRLTSLFVRCAQDWGTTDGTREALKGLRQVAMSRVPPVCVKSVAYGNYAIE